MTMIETTKADVLRAIETERDWWRAMIDTAQESGPLTGNEDVDGSWTFKELLAHIDGWRRLTLARFEAAATAADAPIIPWPNGMDDDTDDGTNAINAWFDEQSHASSLDQIVATSTERLESLHAVVQSMSAEDLLTPGRFARFGPGFADIPIGPALIGYTVTHMHGEHAPTLLAWLSQRAGQHVELPPTPPDFGFVD